MSREKILIVEDDEEIIELLRYNLTKNGYRVVAIPKGDVVIDLLYRESFDLIILDIMLPEKDGFTICREIKQRDNLSSIPIIMLTAKGEETDIVTGLELGADDYVVKPFSVRELIARIRSV
ncbi:MAG: response regulator, partial [Chitinispirillaceae bacterium]|nr:response regulator [Chitinispirillaceae bacterium]